MLNLSFIFISIVNFVAMLHLLNIALLCTVLLQCSTVVTNFNRTCNNELHPYFRYEMNFDSEFGYSGYASNLDRNNPGRYRA